MRAKGQCRLDWRWAICWRARQSCQGILACLVRRGITGKGSHIETSLMESLIDFQFEVLTTHLNDGRRLPKRSDFRSAHAYLSAPYGVYHNEGQLSGASQ